MDSKKTFDSVDREKLEDEEIYKETYNQTKTGDEQSECYQANKGMR